MELSPQKQRTRRAVLDAAAGGWARDPAVSLSRIAAAAGVGRATVHRYFPDREHLRSALTSDSWSSLHAAIVEAAPGTGSVLEVIDRIVSAMIHVGDPVLFLSPRQRERLPTRTPQSRARSTRSSSRRSSEDSRRAKSTPRSRPRGSSAWCGASSTRASTQPAMGSWHATVWMT
ncbi:TetR/AcrR family transcriptional regulator [Streptomyces sp. 1268]|uniref:TetR/AcrR family transcriptional regulator n=1 Tax=Streptomyces sp. 1268 TaxID=3231942 RepID=UPI0038D3E44D